MAIYSERDRARVIRLDNHDTLAINSQPIWDAAELGGVVQRGYTMAELPAVPAPPATGTKDALHITGHTTALDGGGGQWAKVLAAGAPPVNGGTVVAHVDPTYVWARIYSGPVNVRWFGARGDAVTNDTAAIQAAINLLDNGTSIMGQIFFPPGRYRITAPLVIGDGAKFVGVDLIGHEGMSSGPDVTLPVVTIEQATANVNALTVNPGAGVSNTFRMQGFKVSCAAGTGSCIQTTGTLNGFSLKNISTGGGDYGLNIAASVCPEISNVSCLAHSGAGVRINGEIDNGHFKRLVLQGNTGHGMLLTASGKLLDCVFNTAVIEANTLDGIYITNGGGEILGCVFNGGWFEFPGRDMIRCEGGIERGSFIGTRFDGSGIGSGIAINCLTTGITNQLTFEGCYFVNLGAGVPANAYLLYHTTDPTNSGDPGSTNITILGCAGAGKIKGVHTANSSPWSHILINSRGNNGLGANEGFAYEHILVSAIYGIRPLYTVMSGYGTIYTNQRWNLGSFTWGAAAPVAGTYVVGDIVWNTGAAAGGKAGWICTGAGSPGTWKAFAPIDM